MSWQPQSQWGMDQWGPFTPQGMNYGNNPSFGSTSTGSSGLGGLGGVGGAGNGFQVGWNMPTFQMGLQGLNAIGNIWGAWQANKLAKDQLNFTKDFANRNLANQTAAYNTALEDRARARAAVEGQTSAESQAYIDRNRLPTRG